jgi:hypothetical protein
METVHGAVMSLSDELKDVQINAGCPKALRADLLLHPNIPKPLHGVNPRTVKGRKWWDAKRKLVYKSTNYHCLACGVHKYDAVGPKHLEAHEIYDVDYSRGRAVFQEIVPLCNFCHSYIHDGRLQNLLQTNQLPHSKFARIIQHGDRVLKAAGLVRPTRNQREAEIDKIISSGNMAPWGEWRMVMGKHFYEPKFKTLEEWIKFHGEED